MKEFNQELPMLESSFDTILHEFETSDSKLEEICKSIRKAQGKLQDRLKEMNPDADWMFS